MMHACGDHIAVISGLGCCMWLVTAESYSSRQVSLNAKII